MRIGTYNVLGLQGFPPEAAAEHLGEPGGRVRLAHFETVFARLECDVLVLQEGVAHPQMKKLAQAMKCNLATFASPTAFPIHVLTRFSILESRTYGHLTVGEDTPPWSRAAGAALVDTGDGSPLWIVGVHMHPSDREMRDREATILGERLKPLLDVTDRMMVMGDFNCEVDEPLHEKLKALGFINCMETAGGGIQATMDTDGKNLHFIDHIYLSAPLAPKLKSAEVVRRSRYRTDSLEDTPWVHSDHLPVLAELDD